MVEVSFSSSFKRAYHKRIKGNVDLETRFWQKVDLFTIDPFDQSLKTHKLSGKLKELCPVQHRVRRKSIILLH